MHKKTIGLVLGPLLFVVFLWGVHPTGMEAPARAVLAVTLWTATWWITEAIPFPVTSLLPIILLPLTGGMPMKQTTAIYGDKMLFLFMGGFMIAAALERWQLHRRIALAIILAVGTDARRMILGFMLACAFLSMWISNTATTMMMVPIGLAVVGQMATVTAGHTQHFARALLLGTAYAASIGGLATIVGTPTNGIFVANYKQAFAVDISFAQWLLFALPLVALLLLGTWWYLAYVAFKLPRLAAASGRRQVQQAYQALGPMGTEERRVLLVFVAVALAWIFRSLVLKYILPAIDDTMIALAGAVALFLVPDGSGKGQLLDWPTAVKIPWGIILLFGGGLALAAAFQHSGLAAWVGSRMQLLGGVPTILVLLAVVTLVNFLTEVTSNVATASIMLPILAALSTTLNLPPMLLMVGATFAASCAFMLPVATAPNAIAFSSGHIRMGDMARTGLALNLISILLITLFVYFWLPVVF